MAAPGSGSSSESYNESEITRPVVPVSMTATQGRLSGTTCPLTTSRCTLQAYGATGCQSRPESGGDA